MSRVVLLVALSLTGCFYADPINARPSATIVRESVADVFRGDRMILNAGSDDDDASLDLEWTGYACTDGTTASGCDSEPFLPQMRSSRFEFMVPKLRADGTPTAAIRVLLHVTAPGGAASDPDALLALAVDDRPPMFGSDSTQLAAGVDGTPIDLFASVSDTDDDPSLVNVTWSVVPPAGGTYVPLVPVTTPSTAASASYHEILTPTGKGAWMVRATATDPANGSAEDTIQVTVSDDQPAWIAEVEPIVASAPEVLPISEATLFAVLEVDDDLDVYPPQPDLQDHGTPQFAWSLLPPGGTVRQPLGETGNSVAIDPAQYTPGDVLELRVEIADRAHPLSAIMCDDAAPTCSESGDGHDQRMTWRVEIR